MNRGNGWSQVLHERFNWIAGPYQRRLGYEEKEFKGIRFLWVAWNKLMDIKLAILWRLRKFKRTSFIRKYHPFSEKKVPLGRRDGLSPMVRIRIARDTSGFCFCSPSGACGQSSGSSPPNMGSKDHTCWLAALTTVSFGEQSQDFEHFWFWSTFETGLNCSLVSQVSLIAAIQSFFLPPIVHFTKFSSG